MQSRSRLLTAPLCLALAAAVIVVFRPAADDGFVFDDQRNIVENTLLQRGFTGEGLLFSLFGAYNANWHPVTWLSHMGVLALFGLDPGPHHALNILLHAANVSLLFAWLLRGTGSRWTSLFVASIFALHPLRVESVAWVSERKDLLCGLFWLLAMHAHLGHARRPGLRGRILTAVMVALALMSKPMAVTLPLALLLVDFWPLGRLRSEMRTALLEKLPLLALSLLAGLMTLNAQRLGGAIRSLEAYPTPERIANALLALDLYLKKLLLPTDLAVFYPHERRDLLDLSVLAAAGLVLAFTVCAVTLRRRAPWLAMGWFWYLVTVAPVLGLFQVGDQARADRYTYLPLIGVTLALAWWGRSAWRERTGVRPILAPAAVAAVFCCAVLTWRELGFWHDPELLFRRAASVSPGNWKALTLLGTVLERKGKVAEAEARYREALSIHPGSTEARFNLGGLLLDTGRPEEAVPYYREVLRLNPGDYVARQHLAQALASAGRGEEAREVAGSPPPEGDAAR